MKYLLRWMLLVSFILAPFALPPGAAQAQDCLSALDAPGCAHGLPSGHYEALLAQMQAHPAPAVRQLPVEEALLRRYSLWQLDRKEVTYYDAPGGAPVETTDPGYSFVAPRDQSGDWFEIEPGKWVNRSNLSGTRASRHSGVLLDGPLPFPMAWILRSTHPSLLPGARALKSTPLIGQYTRVYLYESVRIGDWEWYLVGPGQWVEQRNVGRVVPTAPPGGVEGRWVAVDLYEQVLTAYEGGRPVFATPISSGLRQWPTREGLFKIWARLRVDSMSGSMGKPDQYSIPIVPYVMYFDGPIALHGTFWHNGFGYRHSRGCINMSITDAQWMFDWAAEGTPVYVWSSR